jgi:protocatechuate 3,4-dioxygenase beta subunit
MYRIEPLAVERNPEDPMDNDDAPLGRVLTRREVLALMGAAGVMLLTGCTPARVPRSETASSGETTDTLCVVRPEQTEGPYFVDERLNRSDIRSDPSDGAVKPGEPLELTFAVSRIGAAGRCTPLAGALVDVWHCDHMGVYSDARDPGFDTTGKKFLRGYQVTDAAGRATFTTVYPGWYPGRTVHVHFKIRSDPAARPGFDFTSQLYFDDALTDAVHARDPYASHGQRRMRNTHDGIYRGGGEQLMLAPTTAGARHAATFHIALQTT